MAIINSLKNKNIVHWKILLFFRVLVCGLVWDWVGIFGAYSRRGVAKCSWKWSKGHMLPVAHPNLKISSKILGCIFFNEFEKDFNHPYLSSTLYRALSLTWPASMQIYWDIRKEFNSHRTGLGHQHGHHFIILGHQYGHCDIIWTHSIGIYSVYIGESDENIFQYFFLQKRKI